MSWASEVEVAASSVGTAMAIIQATMTRLRGNRSVSAPTMGAVTAAPSVAAETVSATPVLEA